MSNRLVGAVFHEGDEVVLAEGTHQCARGTLGVFVRLRRDVNWADIMERNGSIRSHPVEWLDHSTATIRGSVACARRARSDLNSRGGINERSSEQ